MSLEQRFLSAIRWVLASPINAVVAVFTCACLPLLSWAAGAFTALITLRRGFQAGALVLAAAMVPTCVLAVYIHSSQTLAMVLLTGFVPVYLCACILRATQNWASTIELSTLFSITVIAGIVLFLGDDSKYWMAHFKHVDFNKLAEALKLPKEKIADEMLLIAHMLTHILAMVTLVSSLFTVLVARWMQAKLYNPGGLRQELLSMQLSLPYIGVMLAASLLVFLQVPFVKQHFAIIFIPSVACGLSLAHHFFAERNWPIYGIIVFYAAGVVLLPAFAISLSIAAVADRFYNFRQLAQSSIGKD